MSLRVLSLLCSCALLLAHERHDDGGVVPDAERAADAAAAFGGPTQSKGIAGVEGLAAIALGEEFPAMEGRQMRARLIELEPGGVVAVHEHRQRPGFAYILQGQVTEHRNDSEEPLLRGPGAISVEGSGVVHWWENTGDELMRALVVDIVPVEPEP